MSEVRRLADRYWETALAHSPIWATLIGDHRFDEEMPAVSEDAEQSLARELEAIGAAAEGIDPAGLDPDDRVTHAVLTFQASTDVAELGDRLAELYVDVFSGPQTMLSVLARNVTPTEPEHADALLARYAKAGQYLDTAADRLRAGVRAGRTAPRLQVDHVVAQIDAMLAVPAGRSEFVTAPAPPPGWSGEETARWRDALAGAVADEVLPALARYRDCLAEEVAPEARPPDKSGLVWIPGGEAAYAHAVRRYTTVDRTPEEIHEAGREEIARLGDEYRELAGDLFGTDDLGEIFRRLREDPALRFTTSDEVRAQAERALARAQDAVPAWFGRLPETPCVVREMAAHESEHGTIAYYMPPATDGSRPGTYYVNTLHPETRTRFEAEALAFHEAVPGHHLQIALAQESEDLPAIRRHSLITAYVEGWALYTERLADEMGLYSGQVERLGMLSFDSWRAGRLVVDTAIHALGWSRDRAIAYLMENSPLAANNVTNEIDRYIATPGQALAYKTGQHEIVRIRREAERRLGDRFDVRAFHDAVLSPGPVPLPTLGDLVLDALGGAE